MGTVRVKQEEETETRIMQESSKKSGRKEHGHNKLETTQIKRNYRAPRGKRVPLP